MPDRPLAIDLYTGLHGWAEGLIAAGWRVVGFDIEDMSRKLGEPLPPEHFSLVLQDVLTLQGAQFKDAELIVGSSPCQEFSYRAMPWKRAKALGPPELGMALFWTQFRIQSEASEAAGRHIPMVVENVRGAQPWVGRARANFGSYYLWGDLPALMPIASARKVSGFRFDGSGKSSQSAAVAEHMKTNGGIPHIRDGHPHTRHLTNPAEHSGLKRPGIKLSEVGFNVANARAVAASVAGVKYERSAEDRRQHIGLSRKAASAKIAKIPFTLAHWIGRAWLPLQEAA